MTSTRQLTLRTPVRYWLQDQPKKQQNFGDYLTELFLAEVFIAPFYSADVYHLIGSVIAENQIQQDLDTLGINPETGVVAFWGCGTRSDQPLSSWALQRSRFFGVRGPLSRQVLGLPQQTVLGDPGLLLPVLRPKSRRRSRTTGGTLCVMHLLDQRPPEEVLQETGVQRVISAGIRGSIRQLDKLIRLIADADFVLCGALHSAIAACAYGTPFAFYDSGYINVPFKWADFAASVSIPDTFVHNIAEGRALYHDAIAASYQPLPLLSLLTNAPFMVRTSLLIRAMIIDGLITAESGQKMLASIDHTASNSPEKLAEAQQDFIRRVTTC